MFDSYNTQTYTYKQYTNIIYIFQQPRIMTLNHILVFAIRYILLLLLLRRRRIVYTGAPADIKKYVRKSIILLFLDFYIV